MEVHASLLLQSVRRLTFLSPFISDGGHHRLEAAVQSLRLRIESHVGKVGREYDGVGDAAAEIFLPRIQICILFEYVHEVCLALVRPLQLERVVRECQLDLKITNIPMFPNVYSSKLAYSQATVIEERFNGL